MSEEILEKLDALHRDLAAFRQEVRERDEITTATLKAIHLLGNENRSSIARLASLLHALNDRLDPGPMAAER